MNDMLSKFNEISERFRQPHPVAIWFIDRQIDYHRVVRYLADNGFKQSNDRRLTGGGGLPFRNWGAQEVVEKRVRELIESDGCTEEYCKTLYPFRHPGIWVEMSDGNHIQLIFAKNRLHAILEIGAVARICQS